MFLPVRSRPPGDSRRSEHFYIPAPPLGVAGIVVKPTDALLRLQQRLIDATAPHTVTTGTVAAFASDQEGRDIQGSLIDYVANFVRDASGKNSIRTSALESAPKPI